MIFRRWTEQLKQVGAVSGINKISINANEMIPCTTNGAVASKQEYGTNDIDIDILAFDSGATKERVQFTYEMPEDWDRSSIKVKFYWGNAAGASAGDKVEWAIKAGAISNSDPIDVALGTAVVITDTVIADGDLHITSTTSPLTVGGTPAIGDLIQFEVYRNTDGLDDMAEDAWLIGVAIQYGISTTAIASWIAEFDLEYLVVAGGGGGGGAYSGGGGAGGLLTNTIGIGVGDSLTVTVGAGGGGGGGMYSVGEDGSNSLLSGAVEVSTVGGGGGGCYKTAGLPGGSGSGAGGYSNTALLGGTGVIGQGFDGGNGYVAGGGGGGASEVGSDGENNDGTGGGGNNPGNECIGGDGGDGIANTITEASINYAGGGGGGGYYALGGAGGLGGGGGGYTLTSEGVEISPEAGETNTGGGGGGGGWPFSGGAGGSGIVILKYPDTNDEASSSIGANYTNPTGYHVYKFTGSGSITF